MTDTVAALIPAAGLGTRLTAAGASDAPKAMRVLAGQTLLRRSALALAPSVDLVVVAGPPDHLDAVRRELVDLPCSAEVVAGGGTRQQSVRLALEAVSAGVRFVLVHDAARPLVPRTTIERVLERLRSGADVVVPAIAIADTLRAVDPSGTRLLDRAAVRAVQTPQGFRAEAIAEAHARATDDEATDDAGLAERVGYHVTLVDGDPRAFKITHPLDLLLAEAVLRPSP